MDKYGKLLAQRNTACADAMQRAVFQAYYYSNAHKFSICFRALRNDSMLLRRYEKLIVLHETHPASTRSNGSPEHILDAALVLDLRHKTLPSRLSLPLAMQ